MSYQADAGGYLRQVDRSVGIATDLAQSDDEDQRAVAAIYSQLASARAIAALAAAVLDVSETIRESSGG